MKLTVVRTDGGVGHYSQTDERRSRALLFQLKPEKLFTSGPIVIGVLNPFTVLNPDEICWIEVSSPLPPQRGSGPHFKQVQVLRDRAEFEAKLASQWMAWMAMAERNRGGLFQAFVEFTFKGGRAAYIEVIGTTDETQSPQSVLSWPAIVADGPDGSVHYLNPRAVSRLRFYHSRPDPQLPDGLWFAEADEV